MLENIKSFHCQTVITHKKKLRNGTLDSFENQQLINTFQKMKFLLYWLLHSPGLVVQNWVDGQASAK